MRRLAHGTRLDSCRETRPRAPLPRDSRGESGRAPCVPMNTGVPPRMSGSEWTISVSVMGFLEAVDRDPMVPESTTRGKSCAPADSVFPDASVPLRYGQSMDLTTARALSLGASGNSHAGAGAEVVRAASLYDDSLSDCRFGYASEGVFPTIFEDERDRFPEIRTGLVRGLPLTVRSRNLRRVRDEPIFLSFDDRRELVMHGHDILTPAVTPFALPSRSTAPSRRSASYRVSPVSR